MTWHLAGQIATIWASLILLFLAFVWPSMSGRMNRNQEEVERQLRVKRLESLYDSATRTIIDEEIARECLMYGESLEREASRILALTDYEARGRRRYVVESEEDAIPFALDHPNEAA